MWLLCGFSRSPGIYHWLGMKFIPVLKIFTYLEKRMGAGLFDEIHSVCVFCYFLDGAGGEQNAYLGCLRYVSP